MYKFESLSIIFVSSVLFATYAATSTTPLSPRNGLDTLTTSPITLRWQSVVTVGGYEVIVSTKANFSDTVCQTITNTLNYAFTPTDSALYWKSVYFWKVGTSGSNGLDDTAWSTAWHFTLEEAKLPVPNLLSPDSGATISTTSITFTWHKVPQAVNYLIDIHTAFHSGVLFDTMIETPNSITGNNDTTVTLILPSFNTYYWSVSTISNIGGGTSSQSPEWNFNFVATQTQISVQLHVPALMTYGPSTKVDLLGRRVNVNANGTNPSMSTGMYLAPKHEFMICR